jgi:hypothetical protein
MLCLSFISRNKRCLSRLFRVLGHLLLDFLGEVALFLLDAFPEYVANEASHSHLREGEQQI